MLIHFRQLCPGMDGNISLFLDTRLLSQHRFTPTELQRKEPLFHSHRLSRWGHPHRTSSFRNHSAELQPRLGLQDHDPPSVQGNASCGRS
jgi:hypothetical protein